MSLIEALFLGLLQGITEFLPVSSSGHLVLSELLLNLKPNLAFNVALHAGTLLVVVGYYRRDLWDMVSQSVLSLGGLFKGRGLAAVWAEDHGTRLALLLCLATVPTGLIGLALKSSVERTLKSGLVTSLFLLVTGGLLLATRWAAHGDAPESDDARSTDALSPTRVTSSMALVVGVAQGMAIFPGVSRSGATLVAALLLGAGRGDAARFCFLLSVPAILGALVLESSELAALGKLSAAALAGGIVTAMVVGYVCLALLVRLIKRGGLHRFAYYVVPLGLAGTIYFATR